MQKYVSDFLGTFILLFIGSQVVGLGIAYKVYKQVFKKKS